MGPRAIRGVANLANRFVKGSPIAPQYCDSRRTHGILTTMYTTETSAGSNSIAAQ